MEVVVVVDRDRTELIKDVTAIETIPKLTTSTGELTGEDPTFPKLVIYRNKNVTAIFNDWKYYVITKEDKRDTNLPYTKQ